MNRVPGNTIPHMELTLAMTSWPGAPARAWLNRRTGELTRERRALMSRPQDWIEVPKLKGLKTNVCSKRLDRAVIAFITSLGFDSTQLNYER